MNPYRVVDENGTHVTYEFRTAYAWWRYVALIVVMVGVVLPNHAIIMVGAFSVLLYFVAVFGLGMRVNGMIRKAMRSNSVQLSGNKLSFKNPLRIRIPK